MYLGAVELQYTAASPNASVTSYYLFGGSFGLRSGQAWVAMNKGGTLTYLHGDHLGSASIATDGGGNVIANSEMAYKPFGGVLSGGTGLDTPYRFTNQRSDESATGLYDYNARFYSPVLGRFVSADSIVPGAGNPQALNRYAYVFNNPLKFVDPSGHDPKDDNGNSTNTCSYGYGCDYQYEMWNARYYQQMNRTHYSPYRSLGGQTQRDMYMADLRENDQSIWLVLAIPAAMACAAACTATGVAKVAQVAIKGLKIPATGATTGAIAEAAYQARARLNASDRDMRWTLSTMDWTSVGVAAFSNSAQGMAGEYGPQNALSSIQAQAVAASASGYAASCLTSECPNISNTILGGFMSPSFAKVGTGIFKRVPSPVMDVAANFGTRVLTTNSSERIQLRESYLQNRYSDSYYNHGPR